MRIHLDRFLLAPVAHQMIYLLEPVLVVAPVALVGDGEVFLGVEMMKGDRPRLAVGSCVLQALATKKNNKCSDAAAIRRAGRTQ